MSEPNSTSQGSDGETHNSVPNENDSYHRNAGHSEAPTDNTWEVVSTSNEPATSIDGSANSSAEAFVMESNNASSTAEVGPVY